MGAFVDKEGHFRSALLIKGFSLSFLFVGLFVTAYLLAGELLARLFPALTGGFFAVWGPQTLLSLLCSLLCCALMACLQDKIIVPLAFSFIALFYLISLIAALTQGGGEIGGAAVWIISLYALPPALLGNLLAWGIYWLRGRMRRKKVAARAQGAAAAEGRPSP
ncbi:MAG: hypothetical protein AB9880_11620 [Christensenellales bacterium]